MYSNNNTYVVSLENWLLVEHFYLHHLLHDIKNSHFTRSIKLFKLFKLNSVLKPLKHRRQFFLDNLSFTKRTIRAIRTHAFNYILHFISWLLDCIKTKIWFILTFTCRHSYKRCLNTYCTVHSPVEHLTFLFFYFWSFTDLWI